MSPLNLGVRVLKRIFEMALNRGQPKADLGRLTCKVRSVNVFF